MHAPSTAGQVTLGSINVEAADPHALASFWADVTGGTPAPAGDHVYLPPPGPGGFAMFFQPLTAPGRPATPSTSTSPSPGAAASPLTIGPDGTGGSSTATLTEAGAATGIRQRPGSLCPRAATHHSMTVQTTARRRNRKQAGHGDSHRIRLRQLLRDERLVLLVVE